MSHKILTIFLFLFLLAGCIMQTPLQTPPEASPTETAQPTLVIGSDGEVATDTAPAPEEAVSTPSLVPGDMVLIPATEFLMGCDLEHNNGYACSSDELPRHSVSLSAFMIDVFEVTNAQYAACVEAGGCAAPTVTSSQSRENYYDNREFADFPMINVRWEDAAAYCAWAGKRLPTEAEWELAARGAEPRAYPWGDEVPDCSQANSYFNRDMKACVGDTAAVGSYPSGASVFGVMDMAGNVWEWVADSYLEDYHANSPAENPKAEADNQLRVVRGGGWAGNWLAVRVANRAFDLSLYQGPDLGFRCAANVSQ